MKERDNKRGRERDERETWTRERGRDVEEMNNVRESERDEV